MTFLHLIYILSFLLPLSYVEIFLHGIHVSELMVLYYALLLSNYVTKTNWLLLLLEFQKKTFHWNLVILSNRIHKPFIKLFQKFKFKETFDLDGIHMACQ